MVEQNFFGRLLWLALEGRWRIAQELANEMEMELQEMYDILDGVGKPLTAEQVALIAKFVRVPKEIFLLAMLIDGSMDGKR